MRRGVGLPKRGTVAADGATRRHLSHQRGLAGGKSVPMSWLRAPRTSTMTLVLGGRARDYDASHSEPRIHRQPRAQPPEDGRQRRAAAAREGLQWHELRRRHRAQRRAARLDLPPLPGRQGAARRGGVALRGGLRRGVDRALPAATRSRVLHAFTALWRACSRTATSAPAARSSPWPSRPRTTSARPRTRRRGLRDLARAARTAAARARADRGARTARGDDVDRRDRGRRRPLPRRARRRPLLDVSRELELTLTRALADAA